MTALFARPKGIIMPPAVEPKPTDAEVEDAARKERLAQRRRKGRAATILTGQAGVKDQPQVGRKSLLGQ